jgi:hypothetical protein
MNRGTWTTRSRESGCPARRRSSGGRQTRAPSRRRSLCGCECRPVDVRQLTRRERDSVSAGHARRAGGDHRDCDCCQCRPGNAEGEPPSSPAVARRRKPPRRVHPPHRPSIAANRCRGIAWRRLHRIVQSRRVLAPEVVRARRQGSDGVAFLGGMGPGPTRGSERHQLLARPQPIARKPHDVVVRPSAPAATFGLPIVRFHGVADLFS